MNKKIRYLDSFTSNHTNTKKSSSSNQRENSISIKNSNNPLLEYTSNTIKKKDSTKKSIKKIFSEINNYQIESSSKDKSESQKNRNNFSTYKDFWYIKTYKMASLLLIGGGIATALGVGGSLLGFGTAGIVAGSAAAATQAAIGNVAAGSAFAVLTSLGMKGVIAGTAIGGGITSAIGAIAALL